MKVVFFLVFLASVAFSAVLTKVKSQYSVDETVDNIVASIKERPGFGVFRIIDHKANAESVGLELGGLKVIIFGNPNAGTPLMVADERVAYELPIRIMAYEDAQGTVWIAYREALELNERFDLKGLPIAQNVSNLLKSLAMENAKAGESFILADAPVSNTPELVRMKSLLSVDDIINNISDAINARPGFFVGGVVDHLANAQRVGLTQLPSKVIFFGNPNAGTPLMVQNPMAGYELPLRLLAYEDTTGQVWIEYRNPHLYTKFFNLEKTPIQNNMAGLLTALSRAQGSLDLEMKSKTFTANIQAEQEDTMTLEEDGSITLSSDFETGGSAFINMLPSAQVVSGFKKADEEAETDFTYPHSASTDGQINVSLKNVAAQKQITVEAALTETVNFGGN